MAKKKPLTDALYRLLAKEYENPAAPPLDRHKEHSHLWRKNGEEKTSVSGVAERIVVYQCVECKLSERRIED